jgi:PAB-dependent poly(A)-specific ribonuclease subunit 2
VELWSYRGARKLSLRFLSWALLGRSIQDKASGHDSVEDAGTALALYHRYCELQAAGKFDEVLQTLYAWGKEHGWDPAAAAAKGVPPPLSGAGAGAGGGQGRAGGGKGEGSQGVRRAILHG